MLQGHRDLIEQSFSLEGLILIERMWLHICHDHCDLAELRGEIPLSRATTKVMSVYSTRDIPGRKGGWISIWRVCGRCQRLFDAIGFHQRWLLAFGRGFLTMKSGSRFGGSGRFAGGTLCLP
jgi:hypothetical protein